MGPRVGSNPATKTNASGLGQPRKQVEATEWGRESLKAPNIMWMWRNVVDALGLDSSDSNIVEVRGLSSIPNLDCNRELTRTSPTEIVSECG